MGYILVVMLSNYGGGYPAVSMTEFSSKQSCEMAVVQVRKNNIAVHSSIFAYQKVINK